MVTTNSSYNTKTVVILPTKNEELALRTGLIKECRKYADKVIVVDGNSLDETRKIAENDGAMVLNFNDRGKGEGFRSLQTYIRKNPDIFSKYKAFILYDADRTCKPKDIENLAKPIIDDEADMVVGSRYGTALKSGSMRSIQTIGNQLVSEFANILYHRIDLEDVISPSRALSKDFLIKEQLSSNGFDLEAEILAKVNFGGYRLKTVPVEQEKRVGKSKFLGLNYCKVPYFLLKHYTIGSLKKLTN